MTRLPRLLVLALAALAISACAGSTFTRLAYNNVAMVYSSLGSMLTWMVGDYVDLNDTQADWVRARLDAAIEWHRARELPRYRAFLESALAKSAAPYAVEDIASHQEELRRHYRRMLDRVAPDVADFLLALDAGQAVQLEGRFAAHNRKFAEASVKGAPEERLKRRIERFVGHLEAWVGAISAQQRAIVEAGYPRLADFSSEFLAERRVRQLAMLAIAREPPPREEAIARLKKVMVETETWRRPELVQRLQQRDRELFGMLASLSATLSPAQRSALQARIRGFLRDIDSLTASS